MYFFILSVLIFVQNVYSHTQSADIRFTVHHSEHNNYEKIVYLFAHGLRSTQDQAHELSPTENSPGIVQKPLATFDFHDAKGKKDWYLEHVNIGQKKDLERFDEAYKKTKEAFPNHKIIVVGISRGASTILNYLALHNPKNIHLAILESPFDELSSISAHLAGHLKIDDKNWIKSFERIIVQKMFPGIDPLGPFPIQHAEKISRDIPILLVHSKQDRIIPSAASQALFEKLKNNGHQQVYLLEVDSGKHAEIIFGEHGNIYRCAVHTIYKEHDLPYDRTCTDRMENFLHVMKKSSNSRENPNT